MFSKNIPAKCVNADNTAKKELSKPCVIWCVKPCVKRPFLSLFWGGFLTLLQQWCAGRVPAVGCHLVYQICVNNGGRKRKKATLF